MHESFHRLIGCAVGFGQGAFERERLSLSHNVGVEVLFEKRGFLFGVAVVVVEHGSYALALKLRERRNRNVRRRPVAREKLERAP